MHASHSPVLPAGSPLQLLLHISAVHTAHIKESYELPVPDGGVSHSVFDALALVDPRRRGADQSSFPLRVAAEVASNSSSGCFFAD